MKPIRIALFGATLLVSAVLPSCVIDASGNAGSQPV
jgi:hypothetical protein